MILSIITQSYNSISKRLINSKCLNRVQVYRYFSIHKFFSIIHTNSWTPFLNTSSINYTTFLKIYFTFISLSPTIINNSIFQQIHIEFSLLIINTHHRPQSHLSTPLPTSTRFISLSHFESISNFNHQSQIPSLSSNFHNSNSIFNHSNPPLPHF